MSLNPFSYGKPIDTPVRFIGRKREIEQIYSRLLTACESTSIVGERRIGKTSLLKILGHPDTLAKFGIDPTRYIFIYQDFQYLGDSTVPTRFWKRVLRAIKRAIPKHHEDVIDEIDYAIQANNIDNYTLDDVFTISDEADLSIILLLDEFENVTRNKHFDNDFFGGLRALAIHHNLALISSSRQELVELTHSETLRSSPFFNIFATINLRAYTESEALEFIERYLNTTDIQFSSSELSIIFTIAGYHPYFLQMSCHHLFTAYQQNMDKAARQTYLMDKAEQEAAYLFKDYWRETPPTQQIMLTILALRKLEGEKEESNTRPELERFYSRTAQVMPELERRALVVQNKETNTYHLFSTELAEWIADEIMGDTEGLKAWYNWQKDEQSLVGVLPVNLQNILSQVVQGLNPAYRETLGSWLLDPNTAHPALSLVGNFLNRYDHYKQTRPSRKAAVARAKSIAGSDTPKGLFGRVSQRLEGKEPSSPPPPSARTEPMEATTRRTLSRLGRRTTVSPMALGGLIISGIITHLDLEEEDYDFVNSELKWLFSACDNFLKIAQNVISPETPISEPIPSDARKLVRANNCFLNPLSQVDSDFWKTQTEIRLKRIKNWLKDLDILLDQEAQQGLAGKGNIPLQNQIRSKRTEILKLIEELAELMNQIYGIRVTSPNQLVQLLEEF